MLNGAPFTRSLSEIYNYPELITDGCPSILLWGDEILITYYHHHLLPITVNPIIVLLYCTTSYCLYYHPHLLQRKEEISIYRYKGPEDHKKQSHPVLLPRIQIQIHTLLPDYLHLLITFVIVSSRGYILLSSSRTCYPHSWYYCSHTVHSRVSCGCHP
jgi:hypothetical protein